MSAGNTVNDSMDISFVEDSAKKSRRDWLILVSVSLVIAALLRLVRLNYREFFGSEFLTLNLLRGGGPDVFLSRAMEGATSVYHLLIQAWSSLLGSQSETVLRIPSVVFGLAACIIFFLFSHRYLRGTALAICLLIFAMNPILIATSNDASPYALLSLFTVIAHYFAIRSLDKGGAANWIIYALAVAGGISTHPVFLFLLPAHFIFALLRWKRTPRGFSVMSIVGLVALVAVAIFATSYASRYLPQTVSVRTPSSSDLARGLVSVVAGDFTRYDAGDTNEFARGIMYLFVFLCILLSVQYYRKRTAEAMAMPENVVWIDETQDVVGTWNRLSLRAFLLFQWFGFIVPLVGLFGLAAVLPGFRINPELLVIILPSLAVLVAMGIDAAPREGALALGLLLVLVMINYDMKVLQDTGYGVKNALSIVRAEKFNPEKDLLLFTRPDNIDKGVSLYRDKLEVVPMASFGTREEFLQRQQELAGLVSGRDRVFVIYHNDRKGLGKTEERSPVREWFKDSSRNSFNETKKWKELSETEGTELRLYERLAPGESPEA